MRLLFLTILLLVEPCTATEPLPVGKSKLTMSVGDKPLDIYTYKPSSYRDGPLLVVMHGVNRNADGYRDNAVVLADQLQALVVAPHFPKDRFPTETYQRGGLIRDGKPQPKEKWTFNYVQKVITWVRECEKRSDMPCYLIGHSAGGQILTRMAAFLPGDAMRIIAANPGTLIFPTREQRFPFGFGELPSDLSGDEQLQAYLAAPLTFYLGTADLLEENLDMSEQAMAQGKTRYARGHACFAMGRALAKERGWTCNWQLVEAPDVGHSAGAMFAHPQALKTFPDSLIKPIKP
jgi:pimeloyl-ACP methyl ester carboxylesterase